MLASARFFCIRLTLLPVGAAKPGRPGGRRSQGPPVLPPGGSHAPPGVVAGHAHGAGRGCDGARFPDGLQEHDPAPTEEGLPLLLRPEAAIAAGAAACEGLPLGGAQAMVRFLAASCLLKRGSGGRGKGRRPLPLCQAPRQSLMRERNLLAGLGAPASQEPLSSPQSLQALTIWAMTASLAE